MCFFLLVVMYVHCCNIRTKHHRISPDALDPAMEDEDKRLKYYPP